MIPLVFLWLGIGLACILLMLFGLILWTIWDERS